MSDIKLYRNGSGNNVYYKQSRKSPSSFQVPVLGIKKLDSEDGVISYAILTPKNGFTYQQETNGKWESKSIEDERIILVYEIQKEKTPILYEKFPSILDKVESQCTVNFTQSEDAYRTLPETLISQCLDALVTEKTTLPLETFEIAVSKGKGGGKGGYSQTELQKLNDRLTFLETLEDSKVGTLYNKIGVLCNFSSVSEFTKWLIEITIKN